jgi:hypothetical protein
MLRRGWQWLLVACASSALAGGGAMGTPPPGNVTASQLRPAVGETVALALHIQALFDQKDVKISFNASPKGCAELEAATAERTGVNMTAGQHYSFPTKARILSPEQCVIGAALVLYEDAHNRIGHPYGVVLNEAPPKPLNTIQSHDSEGNPTIGVIVH